MDYITHGLFLLIVGVVLFFYRKKVNWGSVAIGLFVALLLMTTSAGAPMQTAALGVADALRGAGNALVEAVRGWTA